MPEVTGPPDDPAGPPSSQTFRAYHSIRADIIAARQPAGRKLKIANLAVDLSVSTGAVREALSRLSSEQFVVARNQHGFSVALCTVADLKDLAGLRCEIDAVALRRSVDRGDVDWEAGLVAAAHRLLACEAGIHSSFSAGAVAIEAFQCFHGALVAGCGSRRLISISRHLAVHWERYCAMAPNPRAWFVRFDAVRPLLNHALARDSDRLVATFVAEIEKTARLCLMPDNDPDDEDDGEIEC